MKTVKKHSRFHIDLALFIFILPLIISGFTLHYSSHVPIVWGLDYQIWTVVHFLLSLPVYPLIYHHIIDHKKWYMKHFKQLQKKCTWITSFFFILSAVSGIITLFFPGPSSKVGLVHWVISIPTTIFIIHHLILFTPMLFQWIKAKRRNS